MKALWCWLVGHRPVTGAWARINAERWTRITNCGRCERFLKRQSSIGAVPP